MALMRYLLPIVLLLCTIFSLQAQETTDSEMGFWIGASSPLPSTELAQTLNSNVGGGMFYRFLLYNPFFAELGFSYSEYFARTTEKVTVVPMYAAMVYQLPINSRLQTRLKLGLGSSYLTVRPINNEGFDPTAFAGIEFSIQAGRRFRVGLRVDYNLIYEKHLEEPAELQFYRYIGSTNPRFQTTHYFKLQNGHFFHFGLMMAFGM